MSEGEIEKLSPEDKAKLSPKEQEMLTGKTGETNKEQETEEFNLQTPEGVKSLMSTSSSEKEWNANCDKVKEIMMSGLAAEVVKKWGGSAEIKIQKL